MDILHGELRGRMNSEQKLWELKTGGFEEEAEQTRINLARGVGEGGGSKEENAIKVTGCSIAGV